MITSNKDHSTESTEDVIIDNLISGYITAALFICLYQTRVATCHKIRPFRVLVTSSHILDFHKDNMQCSCASVAV